MLRFEKFVGIWNTTGEVLETDASPSGTLLATDTYSWLPGKHFIVHNVDAYFDGKPSRSMEVMGYDVVNDKYFARSFDDEGAMPCSIDRGEDGAALSLSELPGGRPELPGAASAMIRGGCG